MLAALVLGLALAFFLYLVYRSPAAAYALLAATVCANGLFIDVGVSVSASRLLTVAFLPWAFARASGEPGARSLRGILTPTLALMTYVLATTLASETLFLPPMAGELGEVRESSRWLIQWLSFCLGVAPLLIAPLALPTVADCTFALRAFAYGIAAMCAFALVQWFAVQIFEVPLLGIARYGLLGADYAPSYFFAGDLVVQRANSLAREPKDLAAAAAIALVCLVLVGLPGLRRPRNRLLAVAALLIGGLVVSFSTTGAVLVVLGLPFVAMSVATAPERLAGSRQGARHVYGVVIVVAAIAALALLQSEYVSLIVEDRVTSRLGMVEDYDQVAIDFLLDNPSWWTTGVGAGLLPFYANDYLPNDPVLLEYMLNYTWDAKAGLLRWIASFGVIGCALAAIVLYRVFSRLARMLGDPQGPDDYALRRGALLAFAYLTAVQAVRAIDEIYWVVVGVFLAYAMARVRAARSREAPAGWPATAIAR